MDQATWLKQQSAKAAASSLTDMSVAATPKQFIFILCRDLSQDETKILNDRFPVVIVYNAGLNSSQMDLSKMVVDALLVDGRVPENHLFLEVLKDQADRLAIPRVLIKKSMTNCKELATAIGANPLSSITAIDGVNFFLALTKKPLPKLKSRWMCLLKKLLTLLSASLGKFARCIATLS